MSDERPPFDQLLAELRDIVAAMDAPDVELDRAMAQFERGVALVRQARQILEDHRGRVEELIRTSTGELDAVPLERPDNTEEAGGA